MLELDSPEDGEVGAQDVVVSGAPVSILGAESDLGARVNMALGVTLEKLRPKAILEARLMVSKKGIFSAPDFEDVHEEQDFMPAFYYRATHMKTEYIIRDLKKWLEQDGHQISRETENGDFYIILNTGEKILLKPEPVSDEVLALEQAFDQAETARWEAQSAASRFRYDGNADFFKKHRGLINASSEDLVIQKALDFGITEEAEVVIFDHYVALVKAHLAQEQHKEFLKRSLVIHQVSSGLEAARNLSSCIEFDHFAECFNDAHPQGFKEDRYSIVREFPEGILAFNSNGFLQVFSSSAELDFQREADPSRRVVQRLPKVVDDSDLMEGNLTDSMVLAASEGLLRIFETALGVKKPVHLDYGLGKDLGDSASPRLHILFHDSKGKFLGNINWPYGANGTEIAYAGQFSLTDQMPLKGRGGGRELVNLKMSLAKSLGYKFIDVKPDNRHFWAKMFAEASGCSFEEAFAAIGKVNYDKDAHQVQLGPWSYDDTRRDSDGRSNYFWRRDVTDF